MRYITVGVAHQLQRLRLSQVDIIEPDLQRVQAERMKPQLHLTALQASRRLVTVAGKGNDTSLVYLTGNTPQEDLPQTRRLYPADGFHRQQTLPTLQGRFPQFAMRADMVHLFHPGGELGVELLQ